MLYGEKRASLVDYVIDDPLFQSARTRTKIRTQLQIDLDIHDSDNHPCTSAKQSQWPVRRKTARDIPVWMLDRTRTDISGEQSPRTRLSTTRARRLTGTGTFEICRPRYPPRHRGATPRSLFNYRRKMENEIETLMGTVLLMNFCRAIQYQEA